MEPNEWPGAFEVVRRVFGERPSDAKSEAEAAILPAQRVLVADDPDSGIVATAGSYPFEMTMPGGLTVPAAGVTNVGVIPTHRRRGLLRAMMGHQLADIAGRGEPLAVLNASEAAIYGRFGYGLASRYSVLSVSPARAAFLGESPSRSLRMDRAGELAGEMAEIFEAARPLRPGTLSRTGKWWEMLLGPVRMWKGGGHFEAVVSRDQQGALDGYVLYELKEGDGDWFTLIVREMVSTTPEAHAALWHFLASVDLVTSVRAEVPVDEILPWLLADFRAAQTHQLRDFLFVRVLDTAAGLSARRYSADIDLVIEVHDPTGIEAAAAGRFALSGGIDGASCEPTDRSPQAHLGVVELGSLLLGGVRADWLAAAGRLEADESVVRELDRAMAWSPEPFCATRF